MNYKITCIIVILSIFGSLEKSKRKGKWIENLKAEKSQNINKVKNPGVNQNKQGSKYFPNNKNQQQPNSQQGKFSQGGQQSMMGHNQGQQHPQAGHGQAIPQGAMQHAGPQGQHHGHPQYAQQANAHYQKGNRKPMGHQHAHPTGGQGQHVQVQLPPQTGATQMAQGQAQVAMPEEVQPEMLQPTQQMQPQQMAVPVQPEEELLAQPIEEEVRPIAAASGPQATIPEYHTAQPEPMPVKEQHPQSEEVNKECPPGTPGMQNGNKPCPPGTGMNQGGQGSNQMPNPCPPGMGGGAYPQMCQPTGGMNTGMGTNCGGMAGGPCPDNVPIGINPPPMNPQMCATRYASCKRHCTPKCPKTCCMMAFKLPIKQFSKKY